MNLKKFISGISALTIAASAFAGMAVTANAAVTTSFSQDFSSLYDEAENGAYYYDSANSKYVAVTEGMDTTGMTLYNAVTDPTRYGFTSGTGVSVTGGALNSVVPSKSSNETYASFDAIPAGNTMVTVSYKWYLGEATGSGNRSTDNNNSYTETYIADSSGNKIFDIRVFGQFSNVKLNGNYIGTQNTSNNSSIRNCNYTITAKINMNTKKVVSLNLDCSTNTYDFNYADLDFYESATNVARIGLNNNQPSSWPNTATLDDVSITYQKANPTSIGNVYTINKSGLVYSVAFDSNAAGTAEIDTDYATATSADNLYTVKAVLGEGDTITSAGISWTKGASYESNSASATKSTRYILVTPQKSGTLNGTYNAKFVNTHGNATVGTNMYMVDVTGMSDSEILSAMVTNGENVTVIGNKSITASAGTTNQSDVNLTETPLTADHTYAIFGGTGNNNARYNEISYLFKALTFTKPGLTVTFGIDGTETVPTVDLYSDENRTVPVTNGELEDGVTYYYSATASGYEPATGSFVCDKDNLNVAIAMDDSKAHIYAKATINGVETTIKDYSGEVTEDGVTLYCDKYILYDGVYYETAANNDSTNNNWYGYKFTAPTSIDRTYTAKSYVYAGEQDDLSYTHVGSYGTITNRYSGGAAWRIYPGTDSSITIDKWHSTSANTKVKLYVTGRGETKNNQSYSIKYKVGANGSLVDTGKTISFTAGNTSTETAEFIVPNNAYIVIYHGDTSYTSNIAFDCVAIEADSRPSVSIAGFDSQQITYKGLPYTAAKLLVNVVGSVSGIRVHYGEAYRDATDMTAITNGTIVLGAIVEDGVTVNESTFSVDVAPAE